MAVMKSDRQEQLANQTPEAMPLQLRLAKLGLNPDNSIIVASGIMEALGIRSMNDIDTIVTPTAYECLRQTNYFTEKQAHGHPMLEDDLFEIGTTWIGQDLNELSRRSIIIEGVRYINLEFLIEVKKKWSRPKDLDDLRLIEAYLTDNLAD